MDEPQTLCSVKEVRDTYFMISFIGTGKSTERRHISSCQGIEVRKERLLDGSGVSFWEGEKVLELDTGDGCTTS